MRRTRSKKLVATQAARMLNEIKEPSMLLPIWFEFYEVAARNEGARRFVTYYFDEDRKSLEAVVGEGIDQGEFGGADAERGIHNA